MSTPNHCYKWRVRNELKKADKGAGGTAKFGLPAPDTATYVQPQPDTNSKSTDAQGKDVFPASTAHTGTESVVALRIVYAKKSVVKMPTTKPASLPGVSGQRANTTQTGDWSGGPFDQTKNRPRAVAMKITLKINKSLHDKPRSKVKALRAPAKSSKQYDRVAVHKPSADLRELAGLFSDAPGGQVLEHKRRRLQTQPSAFEKDLFVSEKYIKRCMRDYA